MAAELSSPDAIPDDEAVQYSTHFDWSIFDHEDGVKVSDFAENQLIVQEKVPNRILFRVLDGTVRLEGPKKSVLAEISSTEYWPIFGEMSALQVMNCTDTTCNIIAKTPAKIQMIPANVFHRVLITNMRNRKRGTLFYENLCRHYVDRLLSFRLLSPSRSDIKEVFKGFAVRHELVMYFWDCYTKSRFVRTNHLLCVSTSYLSLIKTKAVHDASTPQDPRKHPRTTEHTPTDRLSLPPTDPPKSDPVSVVNVEEKKGSVIWELSKLKSVVAAKDRRVCVTTRDGMTTIIHVKDDTIALEIATIIRSLLTSTDARTLRATDSIVEVLGFTGLNTDDSKKLVDRGRSVDYEANKMIWDVGETVC
jgi:hypothetical protein